MFLTQEKLITKIQQERSKGNLKRAQEKAIDGLKKWPDDFELTIIAAQVCIDVGDHQQAVSILKSALRKHPQHKAAILEFGRDQFMSLFNPFLGSFIIEAYIRSGNFEAARDVLRPSPVTFIENLTKRSETKSKGMQEEGRTEPPVNTTNELLLGLLYMDQKQYEKAAHPLGNVIESTSEQIREAGALLLELERELPRDADIKYYLGCASVRLSHPAKAEERFFQCLELNNPPLEKLLNAIDSMQEKSPNYHLLKGELLIRMGEIDEGVAQVRLYLKDGDEISSSGEPQADEIKRLSPEHEERLKLAFRRISILPKETFTNPGVTFLYGDLAVPIEHVKDAVEKLENLYAENEDHRQEIVSWLESNENASMTAPSQKLLTGLYLDSGDYAKAGEAARSTSNLDATQLPTLIESVEDKLNASPEDGTELKMILMELYSFAGNGEYAEELLQSLESEDGVAVEDIYRLTGEMMKHCGLTISSVISAVGASLRDGNVSESLPLVLSFYRENHEQDEKLADEIKQIAKENEDCWPLVAELIDAMAKEESLTKPFRFLHALSRLWKGEVERAVFEFDQLLMTDSDLAIDLTRIYERAAERFPDNTTLSLALYQLYHDEEMLIEAAHYLCQVLKNDPNQLKDVLARFVKLIEKEPDNKGIWEEMLNAALAMNHLSLAKEVLNRAVSMLSQENAAAMNIFAAKISTADGNSEDTLRYLSMTLSSPQADLRSVEEELNALITREPSNPVARFLLGETYLRLGKEMDGVASFRECINLSPEYKSKVKEKIELFQPTSVHPWRLSGILGEIAWLDKRTEDAFRHLNAAQKRPTEHLSELSDILSHLCETSPDDKDLSLLYARNLSLEGRYDHVVDLIEELVKKDDSSVQAAVDILQKLREAESDHVGANALLARIAVRAGEVEKSLDPVLRLLSNSTIEPATLDEITAEFLPIHEHSSKFLVLYARHKARSEKYDDALKRFRQALDLDNGRWEDILAELDEVSWPNNLKQASRLLKIDCLMRGNENEKAFELLKATPTGDQDASNEIIERLHELIEGNPCKDYLSLSCSLLVSNKEFEKAESLIRRGCGILDGEASIALKVDLAEAFQRAGQNEKSARILQEVLDESDDKLAILKLIEQTYGEWAEREISTGMEAVHDGSAGTDEAVRLIELALERNKTEAVQEILSKTSLPDPTRSMFLATVYLNLDRPAMALAALGALELGDLSSDEDGIAILYLKGIASERLGDYGKAASAFSRILAVHGEYQDCRSRAELNYTRFVESHCSDRVEVLEKRDSL